MVKLSLALNEPIFTINHRVIYGDTDAAGVVYNANYLRYFEIGRTEMMRAWALPYSVLQTMGCILPVTESYLRFKAPAVYDDLLTIKTSLVDVHTFTCRFHYTINRQDKLLVKGFTAHAAIDLHGKLTPFPPLVLEKITAITTKSQKGTDQQDFD